MTPSLDSLDVSSADAVIALCRRSLLDAPDDAAIVSSLFDSYVEPPAIVRGDPDEGIVATAERGGRTYVRLLAVDPGRRGRGIGRALLRGALEGVEGPVRIGADAPDYLFPGIDTRETAMLCLAERERFARVDAHYNMSVALDSLPEDPGGTREATASDRDELAAWLGEHWPNWAPEALRALDRGTLVFSRDDAGVSGFCAWDVNRRGWLGPIAVRPRARNRGTGTPLLLGALHRMRRSGLDEAEIAWVGPMGFYARTVGARVNRVYAVAERRTNERVAAAS